VIKRVDVAYDDLEGEVVSIAWALEEYESGGFSSLGRPPRHAVFGDWLAGDRSKHGRTLGIGCRANGKYCRIYEKGKQLGEPGSSWVRVEVEWRGKDRLIPFDVLVRPGIYLAGAYPCLAALDIEQSRIKTIANAASTEYDAAVAHAKRQIGRLLNVMMEVCKGDAKEVVSKLRRDGIPTRLANYSHHLAVEPQQLLDPGSPDSFSANRLRNDRGTDE
jgi:phage replication initiation protein